MGNVSTDGAIGSRIVRGAVLDVGEGLGKVVGLDERLLAIHIGHLPSAQRGSLRRDLGALGGKLSAGIGCENRSTRSAIRAGDGIRAAGGGGAHDDVAGAAADSGVDIGSHINQIKLQTKLIGKGGSHINVDSDDGTRRLSGIRSVVGVNTDGKRARLDEHGVRNGLLLLFGSVATRRAAAQHC